MRIPDFGSVNILLPGPVFLASFIFALSPLCFCGIPVMTDGIFDDDDDLSFPKHNNHLPHLKI